MAKPYTTAQFWQMYETLPEEIKNVLWAPETGDNIAQIIEKNGLDEYHNDIVDLCSQVFVGVVLPQQVATEFEKLGILPEAARVAAQQLNALVFYPAKIGLEKLHKQPATKETQAEKINIPTPRHSDHVETPQETETQDDYMAEPEPAESPEGIEAGPPESSEAGLGGEDPYREKAE